MASQPVIRDDFPFASDLSLAPLLAFWRRDLPPERPLERALAGMVREAAARAPELEGPIADLAVLERHRDVVEALFTAVFPAGTREREHAAAVVPFRHQVVHATPSFAKLFLGPGGTLQARTGADETTIRTIRLAHAYAGLLRTHYGIRVPLDYPLIFTTTDPETGLDRHFRMLVDPSFLRAEARRPLPPLGPEERRHVLASIGDPEALRAVLPPEWFHFSGFVVFRAIDVTGSEVLSALKHDLIEKESIIAAERFRGLQERLRTLFRRPDLTLSLAAVHGERVLVLNSGSRIAQGCIFADTVHHTVSDFAGSLYERAVLEERAVVVEDLAAHPGRTWIEDHVLARGERSLVVAPLRYQDQTIGALRLGAPEPGALTPLSLMTVAEVLPLFSMAVKRSLDELEGRVQGVIKEQCTAIHPSVEWRFREAVLRAIEAHGAGPLELEPIVFPDVYPLYALADIRGSAVHRNQAVQGDLLEQLGLAREVVRTAHRLRPLPILDELGHRVDRVVERVAAGLGAGDEVGVLEFLRGQVEPAFAAVAEFGPEVRVRVRDYQAGLDPTLRTVFRRRRDFEDSVTLLNDAISAYLDEEEAEAQRVCPHYFEKQRTDGVDYGIYVGASMLEGGRCDPLLVRNLRLWQLLVTCGVARRVERVRPRLRVPLEVTHLVLVHGAPLTLRFRADEKRFDVDGAYNVRYEIVKKRIDKAHVRGTGERLTQPGRLAIVFSQPTALPEYREYLDFLQARGHLTPGVEELELEDLQGVPGLRALRVGIDLAREEPGAPAAAEALAGAAPG
jgi:hypothetical protein